MNMAQRGRDERPGGGGLALTLHTTGSDDSGNNPNGQTGTQAGNTDYSGNTNLASGQSSNDSTTGNLANAADSFSTIAIWATVGVGIIAATVLVLYYVRR